MAALSICGITKRFTSRVGQVLALDNIELHVADGEFLVLVGPSGCGKSTLLNVIAGLDPADGGEVFADNQKVSAPGRDRAVVFQDGALFPWLTVQKNVEFGLRQMGMPAKQRVQIAQEYLHLVHLTRFKDSYIHELSGGMRQRVAIARALALDPAVLLMDEPFAALDAQTREDLYIVLQEIWIRTRKTIIFVTHNVREAVCLGDRVILLSARPGRIRSEYRIQMARPRNLEDVDVARFAFQISTDLKEGSAKVRQEEYDEDWRPTEGIVLRPVDGVLGDNI